MADEAWQEFIQELQGLQNRAQAEGIGPRCDMVEWAQLLGTAHPAPVPVGERLPGVGDVLHRNGDDWCWGQERSLLTGQAASRWRFMRVSALQDEAVSWLPHWALPLPGDQP